MLDPRAVEMNHNLLLRVRDSLKIKLAPFSRQFFRKKAPTRAEVCANFPMKKEREKEREKRVYGTGNRTPGRAIFDHIRKFFNAGSEGKESLR